jgi:hypothetical protein
VLSLPRNLGVAASILVQKSLQLNLAFNSGKQKTAHH